MFHIWKLPKNRVTYEYFNIELEIIKYFNLVSKTMVLTLQLQNVIPFNWFVPILGEVLLVPVNPGD